MDNFYCWKDKYRAAKIPIAGDLEVINFINNFVGATSGNWRIVEHHFLNGGCYWFAVILKERFAAYKPTIWYNTIENHFITEINNVLYDANGVYHAYAFERHNTDDYNEFYIWQDYKNFDPIHADRITRQCIEYKEIT